MNAYDLLKVAGLTREQVDDPEGRLPGEKVTTLWREALARSGDPELPLRAAESVPFGAYRIIDFLAASAPSVGVALSTLARYFPLINTSVAMRIDTNGTQHSLQLVPQDPSGVPQPYAEYTLAVSVLQTRRVTRVNFPLDEVHFAFAAPSQVAGHERVFGCRVAFGRPHDEIILSDEAWNTPTAGGSVEMLRVLEGHAEALIATIARDDRTRSAVSGVLAKELRNEPSLERVAQQLGVAPRTLQRRLQSEGCSFADVLDETRRRLADCYVRESVTLTEVAYLLGFSEPSAFSRAFQRWYGMSPSRYRIKPEESG